VIALVLALLAAHPAAAKPATGAAPSSPAVAELGRGFAAYRAGDYHGMPAGSDHGAWTTRTGCRVLIQYEA